MFKQTLLQISVIAVLSVSIAVLLLFIDRKSGAVSGLLPDGFLPNKEFTYGAIPELKDKAYFQNVKQQYLDSGTNFVEADLTAMMLRVYKNKILALEVPIKTKGREGSWWETPAGVYAAQTKQKNHLSSLGHTYMPWSIEFQGNFFIHGWPYYQDGTPVATTYSGGCIRLATEDAKKVYDLVDIGMPILVFEDSFKDDGSTYIPGNSRVSADAYLVGDLKNNFVFLEKEKDVERPIASVTKLLTGTVAVEVMNIERTLTVSKSAIATTSVQRLHTGDTYSVYDLLFPLLEESSNEAANVLAQALGTDYFVSLMNKKAASVGMEHSHFVDPSGASADNISTPTDLFRLAKYLYNNRQFILKMTAGTAETRVYGQPAFTNVENFNLFTDDSRFVGGKVGLTQAAGNTGLFIFDIPYGNEVRPIAIVVLHSQNTAADVMELLDTATKMYRIQDATTTTVE